MFASDDGSNSGEQRIDENSQVDDFSGYDRRDDNEENNTNNDQNDRSDSRHEARHAQSKDKECIDHGLRERDSRMDYPPEPDLGGRPSSAGAFVSRNEEQEDQRNESRPKEKGKILAFKRRGAERAVKGKNIDQTSARRSDTPPQQRVEYNQQGQHNYEGETRPQEAGETSNNGVRKNKSIKHKSNDKKRNSLSSGTESGQSNPPNASRRRHRRKRQQHESVGSYTSSTGNESDYRTLIEAIDSQRRGPARVTTDERIQVNVNGQLWNCTRGGDGGMEVGNLRVDRTYEMAARPQSGSGEADGSRKKYDSPRLRLELNLDLEINLKAKIHGEIELSLLYVQVLKKYPPSRS